MDHEQRPRKQGKIRSTRSSNSQEVSSPPWEFVHMTEQEEDLINRMYRLVGDRWDLIAGRVPGRKPEEIERFWMMRHCRVYAGKRNQLMNIAKNSVE